MEQDSYMRDKEIGVGAYPTKVSRLSEANQALEYDIPEGFKDPTSLTKWLKVFLYLSVAIAALSIWSGYLEHQMLIDFKNGVYTSETAAMVDAEASDSRQAIVGIIYMLVFFPTLICFLKWVYRANSNVRKLGAVGLKFTPGWSVGWFFVPIVNLWKPYQAMKEIFKASKNPADWTGQMTPSILGWWWGFWIISGYLSQVSFRMSLRAEGIDELLTANVLTLISDAFDIPSALIAILMVGKLLQEMQMPKHREYTQLLPETDTRVLTFRYE